MAFTVFFVSAWLIVSIFTIIPKRLTLIENTFIFLTTSVISINWTWIINEELKYVKITEDPANYAGFLFFRSVIIPTLLMVQLNLYSASSSTIKKGLVIAASVICLLLLTISSRVLDISTYKDWNLGFDTVYYVFLHFFSIGVWKIIRKFTHIEVKHS
ncbi:hypothetical protein LC065_04890 [Halobacillus litoralis]|uniref:hypothetical protein n=1 Tax=Halobacillus litoralis TaxID=45668 RepID=UPI001CFDAB57|nr:hypothetical protein [Halobacillus litoralis]WLR48533.1 hypothetical protein LC065_04890 [Halobacillus litoralis]